jgi:hypothetical protein
MPEGIAPPADARPDGVRAAYSRALAAWPAAEPLLPPALRAYLRGGGGSGTDAAAAAAGSQEADAAAGTGM